MRREELITHPQFASPEARLKCLEECFSIIEKWTRTRTKFEVMDALNEVDVPCGPILSMKDLIEDKSPYERGYLVELDHPERRPVCATRLSDHLVGIAGGGRAARRCWARQHAEEILDWLGRTPAQIEALRAAGAV
ncbi:CoA transferase [Cupriavidus basilensis]